MTSIAAAAAPALSHQAVRDFSDRLSPMLVKELRQGLKSPLFAWGLVLMQTALVSSVFLGMAGTERSATQFFWWGCAGVICLLLPLRAANGLSDEMNGDTLDTLVLTSLSAGRITLGKWLATASLQALMAVTVLPYLIMRYFAGGVNLPHELVCMGCFLLFGMLATAVMLGLSFFSHFLIRAVIMLGVLFGCISFCAGVIDELRRGTDYLAASLGRNLGWAGAGAVLLLALWAGYFFLDFGASRIAPVSENRATRRRLVAVGVFTIAAVGLWQIPRLQLGLACAGLLNLGVLLVCIQAMSEKPAPYVPVLLPFVKRGRAGRAAGRLLYPGWPSATFFSSLLLAGAAAAFLRLYWNYREYLYPAYSTASYMVAEFSRWLPKLAVFAAALGSLIVPLVLWKLFSRRSPWHFGRWFFFLLLPAGFHTAIALGNSKAESAALTYAHALFPSAGFFADSLAQDQAGFELRAKEALLMDAYRAAHPKERILYTPGEVSQALDGYYLQRRNIHRDYLYPACFISLGVWLLAAFLFAAREFRHTRAEETLLAKELAARSTAGA